MRSIPLVLQQPPAIELRGLVKQFGAVTAVEQLDLSIREGEFFSMLGPSGSGKTTVLRLIAGFETPTAGHIEQRQHGLRQREQLQRGQRAVPRSGGQPGGDAQQRERQRQQPSHGQHA